MKKIKFLITLLVFFFATHSAMAQAVRDDEQIVANVNLFQILRMSITNGGNIEFVFNNIDDYRLGLGASAAAGGAGGTPNSAAPLYRTDFSVSSSSSWELDYGAEQGFLIGTDNGGNLDLNNVGFAMIENGAYSAGFGAADELLSVPTNNFTAADISALQIYPTVLITSGSTGAGLSNAGDAADNSFTMFWQCGTGGGGAAPVQMNTTPILNLDPSPASDRFIVNVIFELVPL